MARKSLADIRAELKKEAENEGKSNFVSDNASYPFWNIPLDSTAVVRFLPDGDDTNADGFWVERLMINLAFTGVVGDSTKEYVKLQVPCVEMYGAACPVQAEIKPWYKDPSMEETANKYWKKRSYLYQGFVLDHPGFVDKNNNKIDVEEPENPIRRFVINPNLHKQVKAILLDPDLETWPDDYDAGLNFNIRKTQDGKWASYDQSSWARKESPLSDEQRAAIEEYGLNDLKDFLPRQPSDVELKVIMEMFEASVDGEKYDAERWGAYYRPFGVEKPEGAEKATSTPAPAAAETPVSAPAKEEAATPVKEEKGDAGEETGSSSDRAADILAKIRSRKDTA